MAAKNVRLALAVAIVKSQVENVGTAEIEKVEIDNNGKTASRFKGKLKHEHEKVKRLQEQAVEMQAEIDKLRSNLLDCFVPNVVCPCFAKNDRLEIDRQSPFLGHDSTSRFMDCVRFLNKKRRLVDDELDNDDRASRVAQMADFVVNLVADARGEQLLSVWLHQGVEFVKNTITGLSDGQIPQDAQVTINNFIGKLVSRLASYDPLKNPEDAKFDHRNCTQKVILELATGVPLTGQNILLVATRQLHLMAETLSQADPFRQGVPQMFENSYFVVDTIEKLCIDPLSSWIKSGKLDKSLLEEFVSAIFGVKSALSSSGQMCLLLMVYVDRVCAQIIKQLHTFDDPDAQIHGNAMQKLVTLACNAANLPRSS